MHAARADGLDPDAVLARLVGSRPARRPWLGITTRPPARACHLSRRDENRARPPAARWRRYPRPPRPSRCSSSASCWRRPTQPRPSPAHAGHRPRTSGQQTRSRPASRDGAGGGDAVRDAATIIAEQARPEEVTRRYRFRFESAAASQDANELGPSSIRLRSSSASSARCRVWFATTRYLRMTTTRLGLAGARRPVPAHGIPPRSCGLRTQRRLPPRSRLPRLPAGWHAGVRCASPVGRPADYMLPAAMPS